MEDMKRREALYLEASAELSQAMMQFGVDSVQVEKRYKYVKDTFKTFKECVYGSEPFITLSGEGQEMMIYIEKVKEKYKFENVNTTDNTSNVSCNASNMSMSWNGDLFGAYREFTTHPAIITPHLDITDLNQ